MTSVLSHITCIGELHACSIWLEKLAGMIYDIWRTLHGRMEKWLILNLAITLDCNHMMSRGVRAYKLHNTRTYICEPNVQCERSKLAEDRPVGRVLLILAAAHISLSVMESTAERRYRSYSTATSIGTWSDRHMYTDELRNPRTETFRIWAQFSLCGLYI